MKLDHPPPPDNQNDNQKIEPETQSEKAKPPIVTALSREFEENEVTISCNQDKVMNTDDKNSLSLIVTGGGGDQNGGIVENEFQNVPYFPYCESLSLVGIKVKHQDSPKIEGEILEEPKKVGNNFTVQVKWTKPRKTSIGKFSHETCFITVLIHETINFMNWREEKLNES